MSAVFATDELGPRGKRRVRLATAVSLLLIAGLVAIALLRLASEGQLEASLYTDMIEWPVVRRILWEGLVLTNLRVAVFAMILSSVIGLALALGRLARSRLVHWPVGAFVEFFRSVPVLLFIFLSYFGLARFGVDIGDFGVIVIALTAYHSAVLAEVFRAGILSLPSGQGEAATSLGMTYWQSMRKVIVPQAVRRMTPAIVSQLVTILKDTTLGYIIGAGFRDALRHGQQIAELLDNRLQTLGVVALAFILVCLALSRLAARLESRQRRRMGASSVRVEGGPEDLMAMDEEAQERERR